MTDTENTINQFGDQTMTTRQRLLSPFLFNSQKVKPEIFLFCVEDEERKLRLQKLRGFNANATQNQDQTQMGKSASYFDTLKKEQGSLNLLKKWNDTDVNNCQIDSRLYSRYSSTKNTRRKKDRLESIFDQFHNQCDHGKKNLHDQKLISK